jgi:hypothetical protein
VGLGIADGYSRATDGDKMGVFVIRFTLQL